MDESKNLFFIDQDVLEASVGLRRFMPSGCYAVLVADQAAAAEMVTFFHDRLGIALEGDFLITNGWDICSV
jgi:hypothetical protein